MAYKDPQDERAKESRRKHYRNNRAIYKERAVQQKKELVNFVTSLKEGQACIDCGVVYPTYIMEYDHRPGELKAMTVSYMTRFGSKQKILAEIAKCDLVCANCHRERTFSRRRDEAEVAGGSPKPTPTEFDSLHPC